MSSNVKIRVASMADAAALLDIYAPYVQNTAISFEYQVPSLQEFSERIRQVQTAYPFLVAELDGELIGYAYAGRFSGRAAYDWAAETSIYVKLDAKRLGIGRKLYAALAAALQAQGILNLTACIAYPDKEDEYLKRDSVLFHEKLGYRLVGEFHKCGYKFDRWYNMVWLEKHIGEHLAVQPPIKKFADISHLVTELQ